MVSKTWKKNGFCLSALLDIFRKNVPAELLIFQDVLRFGLYLWETNLSDKSNYINTYLIQNLHTSMLRKWQRAKIVLVQPVSYEEITVKKHLRSSLVRS